MTNEPQAKFMRQVTPEQDKILRVLEALRYATVDDITVKDGQIRKMRVVLNVDLDNPEAFKKAVDELKTIPL